MKYPGRGSGFTGQAEQGRRKRKQEEDNLIFISTKPVYMNNKLPAWGGNHNEQTAYLADYLQSDVYSLTSYDPEIA